MHAIPRFRVCPEQRSPKEYKTKEEIAGGRTRRGRAREGKERAIGEARIKRDRWSGCATDWNGKKERNRGRDARARNGEREIKREEERVRSNRRWPHEVREGRKSERGWETNWLYVHSWNEGGEQLRNELLLALVQSQALPTQLPTLTITAKIEQDWPLSCHGPSRSPVSFSILCLIEIMYRVSCHANAPNESPGLINNLQNNIV